MGIVLAAWDERLQRDVAVKLIRPDHFNDPDLRQRFDREARTVARIQHPGVIALHDSGELDDGTAFLVMEKLSGRDLASQIKNHGRGTPAQVAELVRQGCAALRAAHRAGVVHRDVKPENIFLVNDPAGFRVKVLDFRPRQVDDPRVRGLTQTGMVMGTPTYMSPEQVQGEDVDARMDVYSFAAVCYEALTGRKVVSGGDLDGYLINVLNTVSAPPSSFVPGLPPEVDAAFASALAKERSRRLKEIELWVFLVRRVARTGRARRRDDGLALPPGGLDRQGGRQPERGSDDRNRRDPPDASCGGMIAGPRPRSRTPRRTFTVISLAGRDDLRRVQHAGPTRLGYVGGGPPPPAIVTGRQRVDEADHRGDAATAHVVPMCE